MVVPDSADRAEVLFSAIRLALERKPEVKIEPLAAGGRKGFRMVMPERRSAGADPCRVVGRGEALRLLLRHDAARGGDARDGTRTRKKGGVTGHPLYQRLNDGPRLRRRLRAGSWTPAAW